MTEHAGETDVPREQLAAEIARLRDLVGPDELAYHELLTELWAARDAAKAAELEAGALRGQVVVLRHELVRARRIRRAMGRFVIQPARRVRHAVMARLS